MANIPADHGTDRLLDVAFGHALGRIGRAAAAEDETALPPVACSCLPSDVSTKQPTRDPQILRRIAIRRVESDLCSNSRNLGAHILPAKATPRSPQGVGGFERLLQQELCELFCGLVEAEAFAGPGR